jgi:hypothetical protein
MRNPIQPSLDRPVPLPDCILTDAWWADLRDDTRSDTRQLLQIISGKRDEARSEREHADRR